MERCVIRRSRDSSRSAWAFNFFASTGSGHRIGKSDPRRLSEFLYLDKIPQKSPEPRLQATCRRIRCPAYRAAPSLSSRFCSVFVRRTMAKTADYARLVIQELERRRLPDGTIERTNAVELIEACGYKARDYAKTFGQAVSLLDAACLIAHLPWLGRLVSFKKFKENLSGNWSIWAPHMTEILNAPQTKVWSSANFVQISAALPTVGAATWWKQQEPNSKQLLSSAIRASQP